MKHEQVELPELGFTVDVGLEELVRLCWQRGIGTFVCCIGSSDYREGDGYIGFDSPSSAARWEDLTELLCEWNDDDEIATVAEVYFPRERIADLVAALREPPLVTTV